MKRLLPGLIFIFLFSLHSADASHMMGGEVSYRHLGGLKYEITFKLYRDCRGVPLNSPTAEMYGVGTSPLKKSLSPTLLSIKDVSNYCKKSGNPCNPQNTTVSTYESAIEEHTYKDTVDFNTTTDSAFNKFCFIRFGIGQCCRPTDVTMGMSNDFWVWAELDICKAKDNSSPILSVVPQNYVCCNQSVLYNNGAVDSVDFDSLSYELVEPMTNWTDKVKWSYNNYQNPITVYWPSGYDKSKGPDPTANPPVGFYLDPERGDLIFTPTDCSESTFASIKVKEWRKDSTGKYINIGEIRRDMAFILKTCPGNYTPTLQGPNSYKVCAGQQLCFTITTDDKQYKPAPPAKPNPPDSVSITWDQSIGRGATFNIVNKSARLQSGKFCWTPQQEDIRDLPYTFSLTARDNICPMNGLAVKQYSVKVNQPAQAKRTYTLIKNGLLELKSETDKSFKGNPSYFWKILDSTMKEVDSSYVDFYRTGSDGFKLVNAIDSVQFIKSGKYYIFFQINNPPFNCPTIYFDTLKVGSIVPFLKVEPALPVEKWVCINSVHKLTPVIKNAKSPLKFRWSSSMADTFQTLNVTITKDTVFTVYVYDGAGYKRSAKWSFHLYKDPLLNPGKDLMVCKNDTVSLLAGVSNFSDTIYWSWYFEGKQISDQPAINTVKPGEYIVAITDTNHCVLKEDTINVNNMLVKTDAGTDKEICSGNVVPLIAKDIAGFNSNAYEWYEIRSMKADTLISQMDSVIVNPQTDRYYFVKQTTTLDSLQCADFDTVKVTVHPLPEIRLTNSAICQNDKELDLNTLILKPADISKGILSWQLLKSLPKPDRTSNTLEDLVYDKDTSSKIHYYFKADESTIDILSKSKDSVILSLLYKDEYGCENSSTNNATIVIRTNVKVVFTNPSLSRCIGDSLTYLPDDFAVNYYGGQWFTENDSGNYSKWPQGDEKPLNNNIYSKNLNQSGGKYLARYEVDNNGCTSMGNAIFNVLTYPEIEWGQINTKDSVILTDKTKNATGRTWFLNGNSYSNSVTITLSKFIAYSKTIRLSVSNNMCQTDSVLQPAKDSIIDGISKFKEAGFTIYPNPVFTTLVIETKFGKPYQISIINLLGQTVLSKEMEGGVEKIDVDNLSKGVYSVVVKSGNKMRRMMFVKE